MPNTNSTSQQALDKRFRPLEELISSLNYEAELKHIYFGNLIFFIVGRAKNALNLPATKDETDNSVLFLLDSAQMSKLISIKLTEAEFAQFYQKRKDNRKLAETSVMNMMKNGHLNAEEASKKFIESRYNPNFLPENLLSTQEQQIIRAAGILKIDLHPIREERMQIINTLMKSLNFNMEQAFIYSEHRSPVVISQSISDLYNMIVMSIDKLLASGVTIETACADLENVFDGKPSSFSQIYDPGQMNAWPGSYELAKAILASRKEIIIKNHAISLLSKAKGSYLQTIYNLPRNLSQTAMGLFSKFKNCRLTNHCPANLEDVNFENPLKELMARKGYEAASSSLYGSLALMIVYLNPSLNIKSSSEDILNAIEKFDFKKEFTRVADLRNLYGANFNPVGNANLTNQLAIEAGKNIQQMATYDDVLGYTVFAQQAPAIHTIEFARHLENFVKFYLKNGTLDSEVYNAMWKPGDLSFAYPAPVKSVPAANLSASITATATPYPIVTSTPTDYLNTTNVVLGTLAVAGMIFVCNSIRRSGHFFFASNKAPGKAHEKVALVKKHVAVKRI